MKISLVLIIIFISGACCCSTNKSYKGSCLLKPTQRFVYLYKLPSTTSTPVDSIINDTVAEDYPVLTINDINNEFAHVEIVNDANSTLNQSGWIELRLLGINPATTDTIRLYKKPDEKSEISCYINHPCWGDLYTIKDCSNNWLKITTIEENTVKEGWLSPPDQCDNPYSACN